LPVWGTVVDPYQYIKKYIMNNQKQFGVWMNTQGATIVGREEPEAESVKLLASVSGEKTPPNSSEKNEHNEKQSLQLKYFKQIAAHLQNATYIHVSGTGQVQEQFIHYLADTPQFKNTKTDESTSNKMSDDKLVEFMAAKLN
jgi:stalled ribosome rescue protein Dom34